MKKIKQFIKPLIFGNGGSVSIFAICIILPIFIINALLIDMVRIMSAERQLDNAVESAVRSTMSQYDSSLADYGIFVTGNDSLPIFEKTLEEQLFTPGELEGYSNLSQVSISSSSASFDTDRDILNPDIFKYQINETMKYQAPIQMAGVFTDMLKQAKTEVDPARAEDMEETQEFLEKFEEVMELVKKRNAELKKADEEVKSLKEDITSRYNSKIVGKESSSEKIPESIKSNMADLSKYYPRYLELKNKHEKEDSEDEESEEELSDEEKEDKEKKRDDEEEELGYFEDARSKFNTETLPTEGLIQTNYGSYKEDILKALFGSGNSSSPSNNSAMDYNNEIKEMVGSTDGLEEINKLILDNEFFTSIENDFESLDDYVLGKADAPGTMTSFGNLQRYGLLSQASIFKLAVNSETKEAPGFVEKAASDLISDADTNIDSITTSWKKYEESEEILQKDERYDETYDEAEEQADESFGKLLETLNDALGMAESYSADQEIYNTLEMYNSKYSGAGSDGELIAEEDRKEFITKAFDKLQRMFELMSNPYAIRSEIYMNEYIMANFGVSKPFGIKQESFNYDTKQAMYMIYGHHQSGANYGQFLMEVTSIILAVNLFDALVKNPLSKLGWIGVALAIAVAIAATVDDLNEFLNNEDGLVLNIFGKKNAKGGPPKPGQQNQGFAITPELMTRIFLSFRSLDQTFNAEKRIRIQSALSEATGVDFTNNGQTYLNSNVRGQVNLLFLPTFFPGKVEGNDYIFDKEKHYSY